jgi:hypothetical protein
MHRNVQYIQNFTHNGGLPYPRHDIKRVECSRLEYYKAHARESSYIPRGVQAWHTSTITLHRARSTAAWFRFSKLIRKNGNLCIFIYFHHWGSNKNTFRTFLQKMTSSHRSNKFVTISRGTKIPPDKVWAIHCVQILRARRARAKIRQNRDLDTLYITPRVKQMTKRVLFDAYCVDSDCTRT